MAHNKFTVDGTTYIDLSTTGIETADDIPAGKYGYLRTGERVLGTGGNMASNPLSGKILAVTGDSICYGTGYTGGYAKIIGDENNMTVQNIAVGGATVAYIGGDFTICQSISDLRADADYVLLEGGGNDAQYNNTGVTLGSITSGYTDSLNINTFAGAFETMLKNAIARFPNKKIGYLFIHKCVDNFDSRVSNSYYGIAKAACEKWGIPYLDLNTMCPAIGHISALASTYTVNGGDGIHLNEDGYRLFYVPKITAWMRTL